MIRFVAILLFLIAFIPSGCGVVASTAYPNALIGADGEQIFLDEIEDIVNNTYLMDDDKREQLRNLGIEDEALIDILLVL